MLLKSLMYNTLDKMCHLCFVYNYSEYYNYNTITIAKFNYSDRGAEDCFGGRMQALGKSVLGPKCQPTESDNSGNHY